MAPPAPRPPQVTYAAWAVIAGSLVLLVSAFQQVSTLHSLDTRTAVERLIADGSGGLGIGVDTWLRILKAAGMVAGACAAAAAILGWQALQRSRTARVVLLVVTVPLVLAGLAVGPLWAIVVAAAVIVLWLPAANAWFEADRPPAPPTTGAASSSGHAPQQPGPYPSATASDGARYTTAPYPVAPHPVAPYPAAAHPGVPADAPQRRPGTVTAAAVITIVLSGLTAALGLLLAVVGSTMAPDMMDELDRRGYDTSEFTVHELAVGFAVTGVVLAVIAIAAVVSAVLVLRRSRVARIALTVLSGLCAAVSLLGISSGGSVVSLVGAVAVLVLLHRRSARAWFAAGPGRGAAGAMSPPQPPSRPQG